MHVVAALAPSSGADGYGPQVVVRTGTPGDSLAPPSDVGRVTTVVRSVDFPESRISASFSLQPLTDSASSHIAPYKHFSLAGFDDSGSLKPAQYRLTVLNISFARFSVDVTVLAACRTVVEIFLAAAAWHGNEHPTSARATITTCAGDA
jgi:hypothetical protein